MVLGIEPRTLHVLDKCLPTELHSSLAFFFLVLFLFLRRSQHVVWAGLELTEAHLALPSECQSVKVSPSLADCIQALTPQTEIRPSTGVCSVSGAGNPEQLFPLTTLNLSWLKTVNMLPARKVGSMVSPAVAVGGQRLRSNTEWRIVCSAAIRQV